MDNFSSSIKKWVELDNKVYSDKYLLLLHETAHHPLFLKKILIIEKLG